MPTIGKTARDLEIMVMNRLLDGAACKDVLTGVVVSESGDAGDWTVTAKVRSELSVPPECDREIESVAADLRREFHLLVLE